MGISIWHLLLILIIVFVLFGAGKLPRVMGDVGRSIHNLREGLKGGNTQDNTPVEQARIPANKDDHQG